MRKADENLDAAVFIDPEVLEEGMDYIVTEGVEEGGVGCR